MNEIVFAIVFIITVIILVLYFKYGYFNYVRTETVATFSHVINILNDSSKLLNIFQKNKLLSDKSFNNPKLCKVPQSTLIENNIKMNLILTFKSVIEKNFDSITQNEIKKTIEENTGAKVTSIIKTDDVCNNSSINEKFIKERIENNDMNLKVELNIPKNKSIKVTQINNNINDLNAQKKTLIKDLENENDPLKQNDKKHKITVIDEQIEEDMISKDHEEKKEDNNIKSEIDNKNNELLLKEKKEKEDAKEKAKAETKRLLDLEKLLIINVKKEAEQKEKDAKDEAGRIKAARIKNDAEVELKTIQEKERIAREESKRLLEIKRLDAIEKKKMAEHAEREANDDAARIKAAKKKAEAEAELKIIQEKERIAREESKRLLEIKRLNAIEEKKMAENAAQDAKDEAERIKAAKKKAEAEVELKIIQEKERIAREEETRKAKEETARIAREEAARITEEKRIADEIKRKNDERLSKMLKIENFSIKIKSDILLLTKNIDQIQINVNKNTTILNNEMNVIDNMIKGINQKKITWRAESSIYTKYKLKTIDIGELNKYPIFKNMLSFINDKINNVNISLIKKQEKIIEMTLNEIENYSKNKLNDINTLLNNMENNNKQIDQRQINKKEKIINKLTLITEILIVINKINDEWKTESLKYNQYVKLLQNAKYINYNNFNKNTSENTKMLNLKKKNIMSK